MRSHPAAPPTPDARARDLSVAAPPAWVAAYIGLPYREGGRGRDGCDCWGLVRLVLGERFGVSLPEYAQAKWSDFDPAGLAAFMTRERATMSGPGGAWREVAIDYARAGDAVLLRILGRPIHVGVVVAPNLFLHIEEGIDAALERLDDLKWQRRVIAVYRWEGACAA